MTSQPIPFAIASDEAVSKPYSRQRLLNLYPEKTQTNANQAPMILGRCGLRPWGVAGEGPIRGSCVMDGVLYVVSGTMLSSVDAGGLETGIGSIGDSGFVIMATNGPAGNNQLAIATGNAWVEYLDGYFIWGRNITGRGYLYNATTGTFGEIADTDLFLAGQGKFQISEVLDGASYDALDFATAESSPDKLIRGKVDGADLLLFGEDTGEPWYNADAADFAFARQNQTIIRKGILGVHLVALLDNTTFWVGKDPEAGGGAIVYRLAGGLQGQRISTHAVEEALATVTDWSLVRCIPYIVNGHSFFHIILADQESWVYDCATTLWHEESTLGLGRWQGNSHSYAYGKQIIGSCNSGDLFQLDPDYFFDGTDTLIEAEMVSVRTGKSTTWKELASFEIDMEVGVGLTSGQGSVPQVMAAYSKDGGLTWSNEKWRSIGLIGNFTKRVMWQQWGRFRTIVIKVRITDPVRRAFYNYFADIV